MTPQDDKHDKALEGSFPASDPPANSGIVGPKTDQGAPRERDEVSRPKRTPTDRHGNAGA